LGGRRFDCIVANPPYIASADAHFNGPLRFEPRLALDGGPDGLDAFRQILKGAEQHLRAGGRLLFEHGFDQRPGLTALAADAGFRSLAAVDDFAGLPRVLVLAHA
jgi:release factor glutamine methyltransferase